MDAEVDWEVDWEVDPDVDAGAIVEARAAYDRSAWDDTCAWYAEADRHGELSSEDLARWATAAYLTGRDADSDALWARAHEACLQRDDPAGAARCAFWLGMSLMLRAEMARGGAWFGRAHQVLEDVEGPTAEHGYLMIPGALHHLGEGDTDGAREIFIAVADLGKRYGDRDLLAFGRLGQGQAAVAAGDTARGLAVLDEAMVAVSAGEVGPIASGIIFCAVIEACQEAFDLRRAQEWTHVMTRWCADQPDLAPYRGQCSVYRAQVLRAHGQWTDALHEAEQACARLGAPPPHPAVGMAHYELGELMRIRGDLEAAETAYRQASRAGHSPQPGLALLDLSRGRVAAARAALDRCLDEAVHPSARARLLSAAVETAIEGGDLAAARAASDELSAVATQVEAPMLRALAAHAEGAVLLAEGEDSAASLRLGAAVELWRDLDAPHDMARSYVLLARACRRLGDTTTAELDLDAACVTFERLGATGDLRAAKAVMAGEGRGTDELSSRELEVLRLVAAGKSNRDIADALVLSEHTVRRHLQNIFTKLDLSSRSAATAYAFKHHLV